jgi:PEP-CTERM motif
MNKFLITTALLLAMGAMPAKAVTITFCGPQTEGGSCEGPNETQVFLNEGHTESSGSGTVGVHGPTLLFTVDGGALDPHVDTGGGFANITSANADKKTFPAADFNGIDITIPGFTFTDIAFDVQLNPTEASGTDSFTAQAFSGAHISDGTATGSDTPNDDKQFSLTAVGGAFDEVNLLSADGFKEIKHIEISGLAAVPEPSTWALMGLGFAALGLLGYRKTRSHNALA